MKKAIIFLTMILVLVFTAGTALSVNGPDGPAPNSGDGVSDGSGVDNGPNSDSGGSPGPAPNSGDGVSDGSGF
ncbi:MAG: hypothetical protein ABIK68_19780 [bacterium]